MVNTISGSSWSRIWGDAYVVLLDYLLKAGVVELSELGKIVDVGNDVAEVFLEEHKIILGGTLVKVILGLIARLLKSLNDFKDLFLGSQYSTTDIVAPHMLKGKDLVQLGF